MAVGGKHIHHPHILVDQGVGRINDAEFRFAAIDERQRRAHAVGPDQTRCDPLHTPRLVNASRA